MLTRSWHGNHLYLTTTVDGEEISFFTDAASFPRTAVEILIAILGRRRARTSAHAELRDALDPLLRLGRAIDIFLDALGMAIEHALGSTALAGIDDGADRGELFEIAQEPDRGTARHQIHQRPQPFVVGDTHLLMDVHQRPVVDIEHPLRQRTQRIRFGRNALRRGGMGAQSPKVLTAGAVQASDVVITMGCGDACPFFPGVDYRDWVLDDPAGRGVEAVRPIRDEIRSLVEELVAELLPAHR
ncbi:hypothetical protein NWFMUON74_40170 [Nocardia wallacei]|uniref:Phosphotyrosine protein phosphatase I domain-containing protein n=1 Tax=Nocardia wallacei TaxID=480035 RepID=A0A7G1KLY1_9NOCA|nr:hypothetical protein NWFMUON74_40170 [Nocardia wallacei]